MEISVKSIPMSLGFIGGSLNSAVGYTHFVSSTMDNKWSLNAGSFSTNSQYNKESAQLYGVASDRVYESWQEMIEKERTRLDAVVILTPTPTHFEIVMSCLDEGIPVICEKSLTTSSGDAKIIRDTCIRKKKFLVVTYNYSGYPIVRELRSIIENNILGDVLHFQAEMPQEGYIRVDGKGNKPVPQAWRLKNEKIPMIHLDLGSHIHQLLYYLIRQKPVEVIADQKSYGWFQGVIDNVTCLCRYTEGVQGQIWFSKSALGHRNGLRLRIYGSKASAEWIQANPEELLISYSDGRREIMDRASAVEVASLKRYNRFKSGHPAGFIEAFGNLYSDIADCLCEYKSTGSWHSDNVFGVDLAYEGLAMLEAINVSVESRKWEEIQHVDS